MDAKLFSAVSAALLLSFISLDGAIAGGRCSPGFHRNAYGRCSANAAPSVVAPAPPVVIAPAAPVVVAPAAPVVVAPAICLPWWIPLAPTVEALCGCLASPADAASSSLAPRCYGSAGFLFSAPNAAASRRASRRPVDNHRSIRAPSPPSSPVG